MGDRHLYQILLIDASIGLIWPKKTDCIIYQGIYYLTVSRNWKENTQWGITLAFCFCTHLLTAKKPNALCGSYLQCTTIGPASGGLQVLTLRKKARKGVGCSGTPWSGQAVNWNCLTSLFSLEPFCETGTLAEIWSS